MLTRSQPAVLLGRREPRVRSCPPYARTDGDDAIELAAIAGLYLDDWEQDVLRDAMGRTQDDRWAATESGLLTPRQNGKGAILEARELAGLFLLGEKLILHTAHEVKTSAEAFLRMRALIEGSDEFRTKTRAVRASHGEEGFVTTSGQRLRYLARSKASGRGFSGDLVVLDEAWALTDKMMGAILPTISARTISGDPQIWYTSSAGDATSHTLARIRARGHEGDARLYFAEWSAPDDADPDDKEAWAMANPGLGIRISEDFIETTERAVMSDTEFARERLGIWPSESTERAIPAALWNAVCHPDAAAKRKGARFGLEVAGDHSSAAIAAWDGAIGELVDHRAGIDWVLGRLAGLTSRYGGTVTVDGIGPAAFLAPTLEASKIKVERLPHADVYSACARIFAAVADGAIKVRATVQLDEAVAVARKKSASGDRFEWRRDVGDVTPFFALTLAFGPSETPAAVARVIHLDDIPDEDE